MLPLYAPPTQQWSSRMYSSRGHDHLAADDLPDDGLAPLTKWAQRFIYQRLHPPQINCSMVKFIVMHPHVGGFGAQLGVYSQ
eukprot:417370-Prymnesium_polylepis.1